MYLSLIRNTDNGVQTEGTMYLCDSFGNVLLRFDTLELSYKNNQRSISCVPVGTYIVRSKRSMRFGRCWELVDVPDRDAILIHAGNFNSHTRGCILIGVGYRDINDDGQQDVLNSKISMSNLFNTLTASTSIRIVNKWDDLEVIKSKNDQV